MSEIISQFVDALRAADCAPHDVSDIIADNEDHTIRLAKDRKDKRLAYCLTVESDGFAHGNWINYDSNYKGKWHSLKAVKSQTKEERADIDARIKAAEALKRAATDKRHAEAAIEAKRLWDRCKPADSHPYLERKGVQAHGARIDGKDLIYQGVSNGKILTYQRIQPDSTKLFLAGAKKQGTFFPMTTASEPKNIIIVCEGCSTGASIREATQLPVVCAFDAGNLVHVAKEMRSKYPDSIIVIAADNDQYGDKNTGQIMAQQAAVKVGGFIAIPEFEDKTGSPTDMNDAHTLYGLAKVKELILAATKQQPGQPEHHDNVPSIEPDNLIPMHVHVESGNLSPEFDDKKMMAQLRWKKWPTDTENGKMEPASLHNIMVYLRHNRKYSGLFRYDRFSGRVILHREPFWQSLLEEQFKVCAIKDEHYDYIEESMEIEGLAPNDGKIRRGIYTVAKANWINPPLEYFNKLHWDRIPRLEKWLVNYLGADGDTEYLAAVGMAWLVAGVARIYEPGCKAENMLVLEGIQGVKKSTALSILANIGSGGDEESYFCDTLGFDEIKEKDTVLKTKGKLIVEMADMAGWGDREKETVKQWMSVQTDEIRVPYGREMEKFPRQFILAGSTNESHWLKDQTGNRRFWPVKCGDIDIEALKRDREQLWAEAVHIYKTKAVWWIGRENPVWIKAEAEQDDRLLEDIWYHPIQQFVKTQNFVTVKEILESMKIEVKDQTRKQQTQVSGVLKRLKFVSKKKRIGGIAVQGWERECVQSNLPVIIDADVEEIEF